MVVSLVPASSLGFESEIILEICVRPSRLDAVATKLAAHLGVRYVASTMRSSSLLARNSKARATRERDPTGRRGRQDPFWCTSRAWVGERLPAQYWGGLRANVTSRSTTLGRRNGDHSR